MIGQKAATLKKIAVYGCFNETIPIFGTIVRIFEDSHFNLTPKLINCVNNPLLLLNSHSIEQRKA